MTNFKFQTRYLFIAVVLFMAGLIAIQFYWIYQAALLKEKQFEYTVVSAINKAITELNKEDSVCIKVTSCFDKNGLSCCDQKDISANQWNSIDSLIKTELIHNKINVPFEFQLSTQPHPHPIGKENRQHKCFTVKSGMTTAKGERIWLHVTFPMLNQFILAQMGWLFMLSIGLIVLTIIAFILIYRQYHQEQLLARDTRNFINNLTHEFKTPLAAIQLANNRIIKATSSQVDTTAYTRIISQENHKLDQHINYLLDLSRLQKGKMPLAFSNIHLHELITKLVESYKLQINERNGKLELQLNAQKETIRADEYHLNNALNNLLDNACKYSPESPQITISTFNKNGWVVVSVSDKGLGINKTDQKIIFQEFSRVNTGDVHNVKGFGLGLTYVWQIVKLHSGNLWLESEKGKGSTFFIEIPLKKNEDR